MPLTQQRIDEFHGLIRPLSIGLQATGFILFLTGWALAAPNYVYPWWEGAALTAGGLLLLYLVSRPGWLVPASFMMIWLLAEGFAMLAQPSPNRAFFTCALGITFALVSAPMFARTRYYMVAVCGMYLILGRGSFIDAEVVGDERWMLLLTLTVLGLGNFVNLTVKRQHVESLRLRKELEFIAFKDPLTGIDNRRRFMQQLPIILQAGQPSDACFLMIDIDNFKKINDDFGHASGDEALILAARAMQSALSEGALGRMGGEEFGIALSGGGLAHAEQVAAKLLQEVRQIHIHARPLTVSIGIARAADHSSVSKVLSAADQALYQAKRAGKDRYVVSA
ncbi:GGDEF domain-containing protein [Herbaspirillum seropedicae]|uniref:GGDEF domain-containing protein n=1 Tax=Herbaspirillum seropedicae TaxID=964 RepID=UPI0011204D58|nr:GGDEF domain-containing protein [Herbaspirillum seropedicae]QDD65517.1 GGDEF domain-containing protein [Herbaspirillum seropedicae]